MAKVRSARGEMVDFDLLKIKHALLNAQGKPEVMVAAKSNFIDNRLSKKILKGRLQHVDVPAKTTEDKEQQK